MKRYLFLALVAMFFFFPLINCSIVLFAQNENGTRYLNKERFQMQHIWLDSTTHVFQEGFPIIRSIPPLNASMPYNVLIGYVYLDSLLRFGNKPTLDSLFKSWYALNDTLKGVLKYMYIINSYNPMFFNQYANEVRFYQKRGKRELKIIGDNSDTLPPTSGRYTLSLSRLKDDACEKFREVYTGSNKMAYYSMLYADYILRVRIISIHSMLNKNSSLDYYRYKATSIVLDTLKGNKIPIKCPDMLVNNKITSVIDCFFNFQYSPLNYGMFNVVGQEPLYSRPDTAFIIGNSFGMHNNQEAIVFIRFNNPKYDFQNDFFDLDLEGRCSLNALRIENGNIFDINNVWSAQTVVPYNNWKQIYMNLLNNIMNGNY